MPATTVSAFIPMGRLSKLAKACLIAAGAVFAQEPAVANDPYQWLEDVDGAKSLNWVHAQNARTEARLTQSNTFKQMEADLLAVLDSDTNTPYVQKIGPYYYNLWTDANHHQGLWRRATLDEYRKPKPKWETVLDIDALNKAEGENWAWQGADCLRPNYQRCLIALSRGGIDANVTREFDLATKSWVENGFQLPEAKGGLGWIDLDTVYAFTDFGDGTLTSSGYPRVVKQWKRGTPLSAASTVYKGKPDDLYIDAMHDDTPGYERDFVNRILAYGNDELYLRGKNSKLTKIDAPNSANKSVHKDWLLLELRDDWKLDKEYASGSLLAIKFDEFMSGKRNFDVLFTPTNTSSLVGVFWTKNHLVLNELNDVKNRLSVLTPGEKGWQRSEFTGAPSFGTVDASAVDSNDNDLVWLISSNYLTPTTLSLAEIGKSPEALGTMPSFFDSSNKVVEQYFAVSKDGTRVPYFLVRPKDLKLDGTAPTLLHGYGGFEVSLTPDYSGGLGRAWLSKGGVYVVANIRGGGEYGPRWHQAALKENRPRAYEDFSAVAQDLINRKITSPKHLGVQGSSNGGLLTGNMLTQYPELLGAVVIEVPLLDMKRFNRLSAGASWMAEYGNPDKPEEWAYIQKFSPYHLFDPTKTYPPVLFLTSTRDDRVHPGHARKMAAKMIEAGKDVTYYEDNEGGHDGAASNAQSAYISALIYSFLWEQLSNK
ncbi:prolyl oligopeptidase family serine peptidase [Pseudomonas chlororaphis]|uniref:prolyl oligopeptidase family serine peptidase n=1 Tax=Pseudomonas chlororaphis TaxID=587753 RepID=UPI002367603D|nr:prolyl oligopeptidase family serine peptidase [Pseudomonas chlororaphis]WDG77630.1 prolyl oligopeptidase family serine peptidase [Pseudomonas chlororaphis]WDG83133.1 prolyl oligopeptidase family serine peptidase [Pseudomonas chlororaphis]